MFRQVTDIAWDSHGNGYISDGYINARVAKVSPTGEWLASFGSPGNGPGQLNTPHSIAIDAQDRVYVADRGNRRIQVFDTGRDPGAADHHRRAIRPGREAGDRQHAKPEPACGHGADDGRRVALGGVHHPAAQPGAIASDAYPGCVYKLSLDGKVLGVLGGAGKQPGQFGWIHEIACPSENTLFVAELLNWRVRKLTLHP